MKTLKQHISEGILDDIENTLKDSDKNIVKAIRQQVVDFLKENYDGRLKVSAKPNADGKFEVSGATNSIILKNKNAEALTNGKFVFTSIGKEHQFLDFYIDVKNLKDLSGAPRYVSGNFVLHSNAIETLKGCENMEATDITITVCPNLKSLEYAPKAFRRNITLGALGIKDLKEMPKIDGPKSQQDYGVYTLFELNINDLTGNTIQNANTFRIRECPNLKSLKGGPKTAEFLYVEDCPNFSSLEGFPYKCNSVNVFRCSEKLKGKRNDIEDVCKAGSIFLV